MSIADSVKYYKKILLWFLNLRFELIDVSFNWLDVLFIIELKKYWLSLIGMLSESEECGIGVGWS